MYKLNQNLKTTIAAKFGQTESINIESVYDKVSHY